MRTRSLIRTGALLFALVTAAAGVAGWVALEMVAATVQVAPALDAATEPGDELLEVVGSSISSVRESLDVVSEVAGQLGDSSETVAEVVEDVADLSTGQIPDTLASLEASLPGLIETADVIDDTLRTLSIIGVDYDPDVPFDEALADVQRQLEGLPETITANGERLRSLAPRVRTAGEDTRRLLSSIDSIDEDLASAQQVVGDYDDTMEEFRELRTIAADLETLVPVARIALVVLVVSGLASAVVGWVIAGRVTDRPA